MVALWARDWLVVIEILKLQTNKKCVCVRKKNPKASKYKVLKMSYRCILYDQRNVCLDTSAYLQIYVRFTPDGPVVLRVDSAFQRISDSKTWSVMQGLHNAFNRI